MKAFLYSFLALLASCAAFTPSASFVVKRSKVWKATRSTNEQSDTSKALQDNREAALDEIAHKLRLQVYDVDTGVYGFESKDPFYGIQNIRATIKIEPSLGLELEELAHGNAATGDHRGLVLVSNVSGNAALSTDIRPGDTIIGVFAGSDFKESCTALDFDETMDVIQRAKEHAKELGLDSISMDVNRLVKKATVNVEVEDDHGQVTKLQALAGDNLRLLLMHHHLKLYDENTHRLDQPFLTGDCGGEGICGTCLVAIRQGMDHLNDIGPQEQSILRNRPATWRAACKTVVGADNVEGTTLRIRVHPQTSAMENMQLHP